MVLPIHSLKNDQTGTIVWIASPPATLSRLRSYGLIPGRPVTCILSKVPGGVRAFRVNGSLIGVSRHRPAVRFLSRWECGSLISTSPVCRYAESARYPVPGSLLPPDLLLPPDPRLHRNYNGCGHIGSAHREPVPERPCLSD